MGLWWHQCFHTTWPIRWPQWTLSAAVVKYSCRVLSWEPALIMLDQNLMCAGAVVRTVESEPALLSETLVLVRLTPSMGVLIAAILHKLSIEFLPKCAFFPPLSCTYSSSWNVSVISFTVPSLSLCSLLSSPILPFPFLSLCLSSLSFESAGTTNERLPCSDWMMHDVIRWDESKYNSEGMEWKRRGKWESGDREMFWQEALKTKGRACV